MLPREIIIEFKSSVYQLTKKAKQNIELESIDFE